MAIGSLATDIGFLLGRTTTMSTCDILFLLGLGLYLLWLAGILLPFRTTLEGNASTHYDGVYVVSSKHVHSSMQNGKVTALA